MNSDASSVYRIFDAEDSLLYVGCSVNVGARLAQHQTNKLWWGDVAGVTVEHFADREVALAAETAAIQAEQPRYNMGADRREIGRETARRKSINRAAAHAAGERCRHHWCLHCRSLGFGGVWSYDSEAVS